MEPLSATDGNSGCRNVDRETERDRRLRRRQWWCLCQLCQWLSESVSVRSSVCTRAVVCRRRRQLPPTVTGETEAPVAAAVAV